MSSLRWAVPKLSPMRFTENGRSFSESRISSRVRPFLRVMEYQFPMSADTVYFMDRDGMSLSSTKRNDPSSVLPTEACFHPCSNR